MSRLQTANYLSAPETAFFYATDDNDAFDREDVSFLARAVEGHDHSAGKGVSVTRVAAGLIDAIALAVGAVTTTRIADLAVTNAKIGPDAITADKIAADAVGASEIIAGGVGTAEVADGAITGPKLFAGAVVFNLGYTPANLAGAGFSGTVTAPAMATNGFTCTSITVISSGVIATAGQVQAGSVLVAGNINAVGAGFSSAISASDVVLTNAISGAIGDFSNLVQAPRFVSTIATGTAPFTVASTTLVANLQAATAATATNANALQSNAWPTPLNDIDASTIALTTTFQGTNLAVTCNRTGVWLIVAQAELRMASGAGSDLNGRASIFVNNAETEHAEAQLVGASSGIFTVPIIAIATITNGQPIDVRVKKGSGTAGSDYHGGHLSATWLSP